MKLHRRFAPFAAAALAGIIALGASAASAATRPARSTDERQGDRDHLRQRLAVLERLGVPGLR
jgi:hypothetical protein